VTTETRACIRGCSLYRQHLTDCDGFDVAGRECRGCLPRRAEHGNLCWPCHRRFELMLTDAPTVYRWLTGNLASGEGAARARDDFERGASNPETPTPLKLAILDTRDLLADRLHLWVEHFIEGSEVSAPKPPTEGGILAHVEADSAFLLRWLNSVEWCEWIGDWWDELAECFIDAHAHAPWRPAVRRVSGIPCPQCREVNLMIYGGESDVTCGSCKFLIPEKWFGLWERAWSKGGEQEQTG